MDDWAWKPRPREKGEWQCASVRKSGRRRQGLHSPYFHFYYYLDVPDPPESLQLSERQNRSVRLTWEAGDDHNSHISGREELG